MCGIVGLAGFKGEIRSVLNCMTDSIRHRGPDDSGILTIRESGIGMRRLSIIDVAHGHQPITSTNGRLSIVLNGEIYNYRDIREDLERVGCRFSTNSDTETLLVAYQEWGSDCLHRLRGMFAFAILDHANGSLFLARDRLGVKPLYFATPPGQLVFGSEIKSMLMHPAIQRQANLRAVDDYLTLRYAPGPHTLFHGIDKFPAAHYMTWSDGIVTFTRYWRPDRREPWQGSREEAQEAFEQAFDEATRLHMISEKPVGAFLSGGLDSTAIVASLSKQFPERLKTFSVGFGWEGDELDAAAATAKKMGCEHREMVCGPEDTALLPSIIHHLDEPVGDGIILPMFLLSRLASQSVTVVQSGEGADEILGGYFMHRVMLGVSIYGRCIPPVVHQNLVLPAVAAMPASLLNRFFDYPGKLGEVGKKRMIEFLKMLNGSSSAEQYRFLISLFHGEEKRDIYTGALAEAASQEPLRSGVEKLDFNGILNLQFEHWLPDDILCKLDKITMANSLEGRVPFMDHKLVELCTSFPTHFKIGSRRSKLPIRNYLARNGAADRSTKRKAPFYIPIDNYLAVEPLRGMVDELLSESSVRRRGLVQWNAVKRMRSASASSGFLYGKQVFALAMLELWFRIFIDREQGWV